MDADDNIIEGLKTQLDFDYTKYKELGELHKVVKFIRNVKEQFKDEKLKQNLDPIKAACKSYISIPSKEKIKQENPENSENSENSEVND